MSDFSAQLDIVARHQIRERIARSSEPRLPSPRRPRGRHALAHHLHLLATKLDA